MAKSREIKGRMKAVSNIQRITKTMQLIATARFQGMQRKATAARPYTAKISEVVGEVAAAVAGDLDEANPLLAAPQPGTGRQLVLVITSNRGLCGGYNAHALRCASKLLDSVAADASDLEVVGKKGAAFFKFTRRPISANHAHLGDSPGYDEVEKLADRYMRSFTEGDYDAVYVVYTAFKSMSRQVPEALRLLPLESPDSDAAGGASEGTGGTAGSRAPEPGSRTVYEFLPDPVSLLNDLLPMTVKARLFQCFNESVVSEQLARMVAMKAATDAAGKMGKTLSRRYNRARQTAITTELSEIISGAAALE